MKFFITGGAGFIGSHFVDYLLKKKHKVIVYDNLILGSKKNLSKNFQNKNFKFIKGDILNFQKLKSSMKNVNVVIHLAANSDIIKSSNDPIIEIKNGTMGTSNVLEAMRFNNIKEIIFTSSNVVYGEVEKLPIKEDYGPLFPISFYGASKLACEALISAYCHNYKFKSWIFRFANVVGPRTTHGIIFDFFRKVKKNKNELLVLGDGNQSKPYIHVDDIVRAAYYIYYNIKKEVNFFNLGTDGFTSVKKIAKEFLKFMNLKDTKIIYKGGKRGWPGDVSKVRLDNNKIKKTGYKFYISKSDKAFLLGMKQAIKHLKGLV